MSCSLIDALPMPCRQVNREPTSRSIARRLIGFGCFFLMPLLMSGCVYYHPPIPVQKAAVVLPKPAPRLLAEMSEPKCTYADEEPAAASPGVIAKGEPSGSTSDAGSSAAEEAPSTTAALEETVQRRERERDCFRDAEARARARLAKLQSSVRVMMQAMDKQKRKLASAR